jgi:hypothetical protein
MILVVRALGRFLADLWPPFPEPLPWSVCVHTHSLPIRRSGQARVGKRVMLAGLWNKKNVVLGVAASS